MIKYSIDVGAKQAKRVSARTGTSTAHDRCRGVGVSTAAVRPLLRAAARRMRKGTGARIWGAVRASLQVKEGGSTRYARSTHLHSKNGGGAAA